MMVEFDARLGFVYAIDWRQRICMVWSFKGLALAAFTQQVKQHTVPICDLVTCFLSKQHCWRRFSRRSGRVAICNLRTHFHFLAFGDREDDMMDVEVNQRAPQARDKEKSSLSIYLRTTDNTDNFPCTANSFNILTSFNFYLANH